MMRSSGVRAALVARQVVRGQQQTCSRRWMTAQAAHPAATPHTVVAVPARRGPRVTTHLLAFLVGAATAGLAGMYQLQMDTNSAHDEAQRSLAALASEVRLVNVGMDSSIQLAERVEALEKELSATKQCLNGQMQHLRKEMLQELDTVKLASHAARRSQ